MLADSLYGDGSRFVDVLYQLKLDFVLAIRSNHPVWLPPGQTVRSLGWRKYKRVFSDGKTELRYIRASYFWQASCSTVLGVNN